MSVRGGLRSLSDALLRRASAGMALGLDRMRGALAALGAPHEAAPCVHVAGTNGKGSTAAMVEAIARAAGLRTGLYTSPHLCRIAERIRIDGAPIEEGPFAAALERVLGRCGDLTFFETLTAAAFDAFREARVDLAVLEVGLGGRLDATNVVEAPVATAITSIALDHTALLGGTLEAIAREKAGIVKRGAPLVVGPVAAEAWRAIEEVVAARGAGPVFRVVHRGEKPTLASAGEEPRGEAAASGDARRRRDAALAGARDERQREEGTGAGGERRRETGTIEVGPLREGSADVRIDPPNGIGREPVTARLSLVGNHQRANAAVAAGLAWHLETRFPVIAKAIGPGLSRVDWPGRMERIEASETSGRVPAEAAVLLDGAHNAAGAQALAESLRGIGLRPERTLLVFGALADKPFRDMLAALAPLARRRFYAAPKGRSPAPAEDLCAIAPGEPVDAAEGGVAAVRRALAEARPGDTVVVTGSLYLVGEVRGWLLGIPCDPMIAL